MTFLILWLLFGETHLQRAEAMLRQAKLDEAQQSLSAALSEDPTSVPALTLQGRLAMAQNNFDLARESFRKAASLAPQNAAAQFLLGFFHYVDNDFVLAKPALETARRLAPNDPRAALFLALTLDGLAQPAQAERLFEETFRLEERAKRPSAESHIAFARMLFSNGRLDEAQSQIARALSLEPKSREAHYEQARLHFERGNTVAAITEAELALGYEGEGVTPRQIHFLLSRAYSKAGNSERAAFHRRQFEALPPRMIR